MKRRSWERAISSPLQIGRRKYRVLLVVESLALGGTERVTVDLANWLTEDGHDVHVFHTWPDSALASELAPTIPVTSANHRRPRDDLRSIRALVKTLRTFRPEIIHCMGRSATSRGSMARLLARSIAPIVFHDHLGWIAENPRPNPSLSIATRFGVRWYIGVDRNLCRWATIHLQLASDRISLLPNAVRLERFPYLTAGTRSELRRSQPRAQGIVLVMVANVRPQKNHELMFKALELTSAHADVTLLVIGDDTGSHADHCKELVRSMGLTERVQFLGKRTDVPELLALADVGVLTSHSESGPLAVLEYLAAGLPVVATDTGEAVNQLRDGGVGWFVPVREAQSLSDALVRIATASAEERRAMGDRGRSLVQARFSPKSYLCQVLQIYKQLTDV